MIREYWRFLLVDGLDFEIAWWNYQHAGAGEPTIGLECKYRGTTKLFDVRPECQILSGRCTVRWMNRQSWNCHCGCWRDSIIGQRQNRPAAVT